MFQDRILPLILPALLFVVIMSPTVGGMLARASFTVWLVWLDWMDQETFYYIAENLHW